jgi:hypothetical protein
MNRTPIVFCSLLALLVPTVVAAQPQTFIYPCNAYLDTDSSTGTGGDVTVIQAGDPGPQTIGGIDVMVVASANLPAPGDWDTVAGWIDIVDVFRWNQGLGNFEFVTSYSVNFPVGNGTGRDGHHVIEFTALLADIGTVPGPIRMAYHISAIAVNDYTPTFSYQLSSRPVPAISTWGAFLVGIIVATCGLLIIRRLRTTGSLMAAIGCAIALTGLAWALTISPDGNVGDWGGTPPAVTDPIGDSSAADPNEDIVYGFVTDDGNTIGFRIDILNANVSNPYLTPTPPP